MNKVIKLKGDYIIFIALLLNNSLLNNQWIIHQNLFTDLKIDIWEYQRGFNISAP